VPAGQGDWARAGTTCRPVSSIRRDNKGRIWVMDIPGGTGRAKGWEQRAEVVSGAELDVEMMRLLIFSGGG